MTKEEMTKEEIENVLKKHADWLAGNDGGMRADLSGAVLSDANLSRADLSGANLSGAYLSDANLSRADLSRAYLSRADLSDANLSRANLSRADLSGANLSGAYLSDANLSGANLSGANLSGANLSGAKNLPTVPVIPNIDAAILAAISNEKCSLNMNDWHTCETTHCRAGWAVHLAGEAGYDLDRRYGTNAAGAMIYNASRPGQPVPNFYTTNDNALADIQKCAAEQLAATSSK
jgi:uncharacterized protein YjbI with pentapeptide repeats